MIFLRLLLTLFDYTKLRVIKIKMNKEQASEFKKHSTGIVKLLGELFKSDFMFKSKNKNMKTYIPLLRESLHYINEELDNANGIIDDTNETIDNENGVIDTIHEKEQKDDKHGIKVMYNLPTLADVEHELSHDSKEEDNSKEIDLTQVLSSIKNEVQNSNESLPSSSFSSIVDQLKFEEEKMEEELGKIPDNAILNDAPIDRSRSHSRNPSRRSSIKNSITEDSMKKLLDDSKEPKESKEDISTPNKSIGIRPAVRRLRAPYSSPKK